MNLTKANLTHHVAGDTSRKLQFLELSAAGVISTDGHRLLCTPIEDPSELGAEKLLLPATEATKIAKTLAKKETATVNVAASLANGHIAIEAAGATYQIPRETDFIDWAQVTPKDEPSIRIGFNPTYMAELCNALKATGPNSCIALELRGDFTGPMKLTNGAAWALLMPARL